MCVPWASLKPYGRCIGMAIERSGHQRLHDLRQVSWEDPREKCKESQWATLSKHFCRDRSFWTALRAVCAPAIPTREMCRPQRTSLHRTQAETRSHPDQDPEWNADIRRGNTRDRL